jgi:peptidyl-prolyl cis-trans isomerase D
MSVLERFRSGSDSTAVQVMLVLVVISFVFFYGSPGGDTQEVVMTVDGERVMSTTFYRDLEQRQRREEAQRGRALSEEEMARVNQEVRQAVIERVALRHAANDLGIEVSDTEIARRIHAIEAFRDDKGKFDPRLYDNVRKRLGYTEADFEQVMREEIEIERLRQLVWLGAGTSKAELEQAWRTGNTTVDVEYVRLRPTTFLDDVTVDAAALAAFHTTNAEQIRQTYDADFQRLYDQPERVRVKVIRLAARQDGQDVAALAARMATIRQRLAGGAAWEEVARVWSEDPSAGTGGSLGALNVPDLAPEVIAALAPLSPGQITEPVVEASQVRLFLLEERVPARQIPFEEVKDEIATKLLREQQAPIVAAQFAESLLASWKQGTAPEGLLEPQGIALTSTGPVALSEENPFGPPEAMMQDASSAEVGAVLPEVYAQGGTLFVGRLASRVDPGEGGAVMDDAFVEGALAERRSAHLEAWVADTVASMKVE